MYDRNNSVLCYMHPWHCTHFSGQKTDDLNTSCLRKMYSTWAGSWRSIFFWWRSLCEKDGKIFNQEIITWSMNFKKEQTFFCRFDLGFVKKLDSCYKWKFKGVIYFRYLGWYIHKSLKTFVLKYFWFTPTI